MKPARREGETPGARPPVGWLRLAVGGVVALVLCVILAWFNSGYLRAQEVISASMEPTLARGDRVLVRAASPEALVRGAVVTFFPPTGEPAEELVKRIVGVPGDTVTVRREVLILNGVPLPPPEGSDLSAAGSHDTTTVLGPDEYFVAGDNRDNSEDSREYGPIPGSSIRGIVFYRYAPADRRGSIAK